MKLPASFATMAVLAALPLLSANPAAATATCTAGGIYICANGATTFPGTFVGNIGNGATDIKQIGNAGTTGLASVTVAANPSIYSFFWAGGTVLIQEKLGNNGIGDAIDVELDALASQASTVPASTVSSIQIPFSTGPSGLYTVFSGLLAAGYYAVDSYLSVNNVEDPYYQINFTTPAPGIVAATAVPEPATIILMASGLVGLAARRRRNG